MKGDVCNSEQMKMEFMKRIGPMKYSKFQKKVEKARQYEFKPMNYRRRKISKNSKTGSDSSPFKPQ